MLASFSEFKLMQAFRIPVESADGVRFLVEREDEHGKWTPLDDVKLSDVSATGVGMTTAARIPNGAELKISIHFKKIKLEISGSIVRSFTSTGRLSDDAISYGVEVDADDHKDMQRFVEHYINSFSPDRMRDCLVQVALTDRYSHAGDGFEMFSLVLSLIKDMSNFGDKQVFIETMLEEVTRVMNAQRASIFLINADSNELEAIAALGVDKSLLRFDYRKGIAGSVFTTGVMLNIDTKSDTIRYSDEIDKVTGFKTRSIICGPITNREDKIIGVIEVLNKRNEDRFTVEDEKSMKVLALIFSSVFHNYSPISEQSRIRRFSTPFDRKYVLIGNSTFVSDLRSSIVKLKDIDTPLMIQGENGVGKSLMARILHEEGKRGINTFEVIECSGVPASAIEKDIFGTAECQSKLEACRGGTVVFHEIALLPLELQTRLLHVLRERRILNSNITIDVRIVSTSAKDLRKMAEVEGTFNKELLEVLTAATVYMEPLRKHRADIQELVNYFLKRECKKQGFLLKVFSPAVMETFTGYDWPGNVAEVKEAVEKSVMYNPKVHVISNIQNASTPIIDKRRSVLGSLEEIPHVADSTLTLKERLALVEREIIIAEIKRHNGNKSKAAKAMGLSREALRKKILNSDEILHVLEHDGVQDEEMPDTIEMDDKKDAA